MPDDEDIRITPAQRAYLRAFDIWLHTVWKNGEAGGGNQADGAAELKDACFDHMLKEASVLPAERICVKCGNSYTIRPETMGRLRKRCYTCSPFLGKTTT